MPTITITPLLNPDSFPCPRPWVFPHAGQAFSLAKTMSFPCPRPRIFSDHPILHVLPSQLVSSNWANNWIICQSGKFDVSSCTWKYFFPKHLSPEPALCLFHCLYNTLLGGILCSTLRRFRHWVFYCILHNLLQIFHTYRSHIRNMRWYFSVQFIVQQLEM